MPAAKAKATKATKATKTSKATKSKYDPFSVVVAKKKSSKSEQPSIKPEDENIRQLVDQYKRMKDELDYLESELKEASAQLKAYGLTTFAERRMSGEEGNFKIQGDTELVGYIVMDNASYIDSETVDDLRAKYGDDLDDLVQVDRSTVKFDQQFLNDDHNREALLEALQPLGENFLSQLFTSAQFKAVKGAVNKAVMLADDSNQLEEMINDLRITHYVRTSKK